jgi:hypothetical protein
LSEYYSQEKQLIYPFTNTFLPPTFIIVQVITLYSELSQKTVMGLGVAQWYSTYRGYVRVRAEGSVPGGCRRPGPKGHRPPPAPGDIAGNCGPQPSAHPPVYTTGRTLSLALGAEKPQPFSKPKLQGTRYQPDVFPQRICVGTGQWALAVTGKLTWWDWLSWDPCWKTRASTNPTKAPGRGKVWHAMPWRWRTWDLCMRLGGMEARPTPCAP